MSTYSDAKRKWRTAYLDLSDALDRAQHAYAHGDSRGMAVASRAAGDAAQVLAEAALAMWQAVCADNGSASVRH